MTLVLRLIVAGLALGAVPAIAQEIETRGAYCNDGYFGSDGGGISGCMEFALRYGQSHGGIGLFGVTPEQRGNGNTDPLEEIARLNAWYGQEFEADGLRYGLDGHLGLQGGVADDLALELQDLIHDLVGVGSKGLTSTHDTELTAGVSGWVRHDFGLSEPASWSTIFTPYGHAAIGNDTIEAGAGVMLALQPASETQGLALVMPKNGAYAPTFGGDGIGLFAGVRGVALETLYDDMTEPFIAEAGIMGQATLWDFLVLGASASCTNKPYDSAEKPDCKASLQMGGLF